MDWLKPKDELSRVESGVSHRYASTEGSHATLPGKGGRTLILSFDGTSNRYNEKNTNVVKFMSLIQNDAPDRQLIYYQPGIGTYTNPGIFTPLTMKLANVLDEAFAWYIGAHITGGYKWLMNRYRTGDKICIFGFSRGAYTARALAGMLNRVGLLPPGNDEQVTIAYDIYRTTKESDGYTLGDGFRDTFSRVVPIEFVGVWDSVSSVGVIRSHTLPYAASNNIISTFRHAMALDERRAWFIVDPWHIRPTTTDEHFSWFLARMLDIKSVSDPNSQSWLARFLLWLVFGGKNEVAEVERRGRAPGTSAKQLFTATPSARSPTDVKEVWFIGGHSDVGGGNVADADTHSLAHITLRWMVRECALANLKILWNEPRLRQLRIDISPERLQVSRNIATNAPIIHQGATPSYSEHFAPQLAKFEDRDEVQDSQTSVHDSLKPKWTWPAWFPLGFNLLWWILELLPMKQWTQDQQGKVSQNLLAWKSPASRFPTQLMVDTANPRRASINMGRPRHAIPCTGETPLYHISVLAKQQSQAEYAPRAELDEGVMPLYVD